MPDNISVNLQKVINQVINLWITAWTIWKSNINQWQLKGSVKEPNILIYFFFPPITQSCSVSDVLFTGGRGVSDFSVLKYY